MDIELRCNRLTCRATLADKAVVTTCSHVFCVNCANELFNASRLCPACETSLTEPDDVVVCSLHPTNDYKTSVLSGLSPATILEICSRAVSFWQYQIHQESTLQQAVVRNVNDKNMQLQRQLDNVVREANGEIELLANKKAEIERDLELERKKVRELQEAAREQAKEYQKLKAQLDKMKKKVLLGVPGATDGPPASQGSNLLDGAFRSSKGQVQLSNGNNNMDITHGGGIHGISMQRTPLITRNGIPFSAQESQKRTTYNRQQFDFNNIQGLERERSMNVSERSNSVNEIENYLLNPTQSRGPSSTRNFSGNWAQTHQQQPQQNRHISSSTIKRSSGFRPAIGR